MIVLHTSYIQDTGIAMSPTVDICGCTHLVVEQQVLSQTTVMSLRMLPNSASALTFLV